MENKNIIANEEMVEVVAETANEVVSTKSGFSFRKALGIGVLGAGVIVGITWVVKKLKAKKKAKADQKVEETAVVDEDDFEYKPIFDEDGNPIED